MPGLLDYFNRGTDALAGQTGNYGGLLSAEDQQAAQQQARMALAAQLLDAGGYSQQRVGLGQALGRGMGAAQQARQGSVDQSLQAKLLMKQLQSMNQAPKRYTVGGALVDEEGKVVYEGKKEAKVPESRTINRGDKVITQEMQDGGWVDIAEAPRWAPPAPAKAPARFRPMTPEEIKGAGLPSGTAAQMNDETGQIQVMSQPRQAVAGTTPEQAWNVWQTARTGLVNALGKTNTGPIAGKLLGWTSGGQIAKGGVAAVAPIMKDLFRKAGEGTFTEGDQKLLLDMLPTANTDEAAREPILKNIDNIIAVKLGMPPPHPDAPTTAPQGGQPVRVSSVAEAMNLPPGTVFITPDGRRKKR
jgi:hypothetical protein